MSEIYLKTSTSCDKMTGTRVHYVVHWNMSRDPLFEHPRIYDKKLPMKKHIPNTVRVFKSILGIYRVFLLGNRSNQFTCLSKVILLQASFSKMLFCLNYLLSNKSGKYFQWLLLAETRICLMRSFVKLG